MKRGLLRDRDVRAGLVLYLRSEARCVGPDADESPTTEVLDSEPVPASAALVE